MKQKEAQDKKIKDLEEFIAKNKARAQQQLWLNQK